MRSHPWRRRLAATAVVFALALAGRLPAQQAPAAANRAIRPSHLAAARALLGVMNFEETAVTAGMQAFDQQTAATPQVAVFRDLVAEWTREVFSSEESQAAFARAYAETLSEEDLVALTAFYRTPLGMRVAGVLPALAARGAAIGQELAAAHQAELQQRMMARAAELQKTDPED